MERFSLKVGIVDMDICVSSHFKEELSLATHKWLWVISTIMLLKHLAILLKGTKE